jgi:hypothetical protein
LVVVGIIALALWTLSLGPALSPGSLASYPPLATDTPSGLGYPAPPTATPTMTFTPFPYTEEEWYALPWHTQTPWPTPTPHSLPTASSFRQGVAGAVGWVIGQRDELGSWGYHWSLDTFPSTYPTNVEHIPFLAAIPWGVEEPATPGVPTKIPVPTPDMGTVAAISAQTPHNYWLIFNECEHQLQCDTSFDLAAVWYHDELVSFLESVDPNAKLIVGGVNAHECGIYWLKQFMDHYKSTYNEYPPYIAGWHFHLYPDIVPVDWMKKGIEGCESDWDYNDLRVRTVDDAWAAWQTDVSNILPFVTQYGDITEDEIWITEMGCLNGGFNRPTPEPQEPICGKVGYMYDYTRRITNWLNTTGRWVDRYAWYTDIFGYWYQGYTKLYAIPPTPSPTPGGPPLPTRTPGTPDFSALGNFYGGVTPAAATNFTNTFLPVITK